MKVYFFNEVFRQSTIEIFHRTERDQAAAIADSN
jgi:hypothetical protein